MRSCSERSFSCAWVSTCAPVCRHRCSLNERASAPPLPPQASGTSSPPHSPGVGSQQQRPARASIVGENDVMTPVAMSQEIADAIPGTEFRIVPDCGHMPPIEKPAELAALVEGWLTRAP